MSIASGGNAGLAGAGVWARPPAGRTRVLTVCRVYATTTRTRVEQQAAG
ncbi:hypothetical protein [Streptomyces sp. MA5143a]